MACNHYQIITIVSLKDQFTTLCFIISGFNSMVVDTFQLVIPMMLKVRKATSSMVCHQTWNAYFTWCKSWGLNPRSSSVAYRLCFLQLGLDQCLILSTINGQVYVLFYFVKQENSIKILTRLLKNLTLHSTMQVCWCISRDIPSSSKHCFLCFPPIGSTTNPIS